MEPSEDSWDVSLKSGNMCLNRFCIVEDAAFELSGVHYLKEASYNILFDDELKVERKSKGKGYLIII